MTNSWCILRTQAAKTLRLFDSLANAGLTVWTPTAKHRQRRPRSDKYRDIEIAVMPRYVFAAYADAPALFEIMHTPGSDHPRFDIMQHNDVVCEVRDQELKALREIEAEYATGWDDFLKAARLARKKKGRSRAASYVLGQRVRVPDTAFEGLDAEIVDIKGNGDLVLVFHGGGLPATVASCFVEPIQLQLTNPERAKAA